MPADLIPHAIIPEVATRVTGPMIEVLTRIQQTESIANRNDLPPEMVALLAQLAGMSLVDPGYEPGGDQPSVWIRNSNGSRVLRYLTGLRSGPHYRVAPADLAAWLGDQGPGNWWNVDGDPILTGRMTFPCPARLIARELRAIDRPLLVQARKDDSEAKGQTIGKEDLDRVAVRLSDGIRQIKPGPLPDWWADRTLYLSWEDLPFEWMLSEDSRTTRKQAGEEIRTRDIARLKKE